jgi:DMSO/TMAO reductase YedYZ heme-binding membrane subunit
MKKETAKTLRAFLIELVIYAVLVVAYFFLVLHFLGGGLQQLEQNHRYSYAVVAILLMIGQAVVLQNVTTFLLRLIRRRAE